MCFQVFAPQMGEKSGLVIGCLMDFLYDDPNPMASKSQYGGFLDGYRLKNQLV